MLRDPSWHMIVWGCWMQWLADYVNCRVRKIFPLLISHPPSLPQAFHVVMWFVINLWVNGFLPILEFSPKKASLLVPLFEDIHFLHSCSRLGQGLRHEMSLTQPYWKKCLIFSATGALEKVTEQLEAADSEARRQIDLDCPELFTLKPLFPFHRWGNEA